MPLTNAEIQVMKHLWKLEKAYMKNILDEFEEPKPATTTISTLLKRMIDKGYVAYNQRGNNREYHPLINKTEYFATALNLLIRDYFDNSPLQFAALFTTEINLNLSDLEELRKMIKKKIKIRQK
jgi:BlaI family transcriptional regulator, penicillinase repressor